MSEIRAKRGSISDSIRKLSGKTYDVYKEIFLEKVRDHIRRELLASQTRRHGIFDTAANEAENHIYGFITDHYDDPFMDWERSAERAAVETLGFPWGASSPSSKIASRDSRTFPKEDARRTSRSGSSPHAAQRPFTASSCPGTIAPA